MTFRTSSPIAVAALGLSALLAISACGDGGGSTSSQDRSSGQVAADAAFNDQDVAFVQDMLPHHEQAVVMADLVLAKDVSAQVKDLAARIKAAQAPEIERMKGMLSTFGVDAEGGHASMGGMGEGMGMMSESAMSSLRNASGAQAGREFLQGMLAHHRGAVEMAVAEIRRGTYPDAVDLARSIQVDQEKEIAEMEQLLQG